MFIRKSTELQEIVQTIFTTDILAIMNYIQKIINENYLTIKQSSTNSLLY